LKKALAMDISLSIKRRLKTLPVIRGFTYSVSPYLIGSVAENRLGLQAFRTLGKHISWKLRSKSVSAEIEPYVDVLERDGVLVIPDFLSAADFNRVRSECEAIKLAASFESFRSVENGSLQAANIDLSEKTEGVSAIKSCLQDNSLIRNIARAVIRREIASKPSVRFSIYRKLCNGAVEIDNDIESILHADLHTPTVKAFYYTDDVDESNGAFVYVKGSHRFSFKRIRHEYRLGLLTARLKRGDQIYPDMLAVKGPNKRIKISEECMEGLTETHCCGKANTLLIANNMGFHRRGEFACGKSRETLLINFRHLEKCF